MDAVSSKQFPISRVIDEALFEHVALSEVERKMLQYSEIHEASNLMREVTRNSNVNMILTSMKQKS